MNETIKINEYDLLAAQLHQKQLTQTEIAYQMYNFLQKTLSK